MNFSGKKCDSLWQHELLWHQHHQHIWRHLQPQQHRHRLLYHQFKTSAAAVEAAAEAAEGDVATAAAEQNVEGEDVGDGGMGSSDRALDGRIDGGNEHIDYVVYQSKTRIIRE